MGRIGNGGIHQKLLAHDPPDPARSRDQALEVAGQFSRSGVRPQNIRIVKTNVKRHVFLSLPGPPPMVAFHYKFAADLCQLNSEHKRNHGWPPEAFFTV